MPAYLASLSALENRLISPISDTPVSEQLFFIEETPAVQLEELPQSFCIHAFEFVGAKGTSPRPDIRIKAALFMGICKSSIS